MHALHHLTLPWLAQCVSVNAAQDRRSQPDLRDLGHRVHRPRQVFVVVEKVWREAQEALMLAARKPHKLRRLVRQLGRARLQHAAPRLQNCAVGRVAHQLLALRDDLLDRERREVDAEAHADNEHRAVHARRLHLEARQRRKEDLGLVRVLRGIGKSEKDN